MSGTDLFPAPDWLWQPITLGAAVFQVIRNGSQRNLMTELTPVGVTYVRFLFGLPVAVLWAGGIIAITGRISVAAPMEMLGWCLFGGIIQVLGNGFLLLTMQKRNFMLGVAYSKTEAIQAAVFGVLFLGEAVSLVALSAILVATVGVLLISVRASPTGSNLPPSPWYTSGATLGLMCGACFGVSAVAFRGAALSTRAPPLEAASYVLAVVLFLQTLIITLYLLVRQRSVFAAVARSWRQSMVPGAAGGLASICWFSAMALHPVADVRALGLSEMVLSYFASQRLFKEHIRPIELTGIVLITFGAVTLIYFR